MSVQKPTGGWKANAYVIFDYFSPTDFKFAGIDVAINKAVLGHRTATGWIVDQTGVVTGSVNSNTCYDLQVVVDGLVVTVYVNGSARLSYQFAPRWIDGQPYGLNKGLVGVGSTTRAASSDNLTVQDAAAAVDDRQHRGLRGRRRRPLHRRQRGRVGGQRGPLRRNAARTAPPRRA